MRNSSAFDRWASLQRAISPLSPGTRIVISQTSFPFIGGHMWPHFTLGGGAVQHRPRRSRRSTACVSSLSSVLSTHQRDGSILRDVIQYEVGDS